MKGFSKTLLHTKQSKIIKKTNRSIRLVEQLLAVMQVVCEELCRSDSLIYNPVIAGFSGYIKRLCTTRGVLTAVKRVKTLRGAYLRLVALRPGVDRDKLYTSLNAEEEGAASTLKSLGFLDLPG